MGTPPGPRAAAPQKPPRPGRADRPLGPATPRRGPWLAIAKWLVLLGLLGAMLAVGTAAFIFWMYGRDPSLPDYAKLSDYHPKQVTTITDGNDHRIGEIFNERRTVVAYDKVPPIMVDAFVAAEDNKFWTHGGVDYWGMFRALVTNLRAGHTRQGASTITQQVVKTFLLTPERTFKRKIEEIILARRLETSLTKQEIMTLYMNQIYFGHGRYGIEEAALFYFGKHVGQVNVGEAALLAGLPQSPENISPRKNPKRAKERQTYVLNQLAVMQKISVAEAQKWIDAPIKIVDRPFPELGSAPEWVDLVKRQLLTEHHGDEAVLDKLGAGVRTTLDPSLQVLAQKALQHGLQAVDKRHGVGRPERTVKPEKIDAELARLAKKLPHGGPVAKESYDAVVTQVFDDDHEIAVDLGDWKASILLSGLPAGVPGGEADDRFNPKDADGNVKKPSERFKPGDVVSVVLPPSAAAKKPDDDDDDPKPKQAAVHGKHAQHRVVFAPGPEGAVVILDVKTRKVRALVGGYASKVAGFNRATMAHRQPGSSFKPFVYATAIDSGKYTPATVVNDAPETFRDFPQWKPKNYETGRFEGPVRLRYALSKSINTVSLQLVYNVKPEAVVATAKKMGIGSPLTPEMSIALGSNEVTPIELTNAEATLAAGGLAAEPQFIDSIDGVPTAAVKGEQVIRPEVAYVVLDMMRSVVTEGTAVAAASLKIPIAGKTGTSNDAKDTWFMGLTPDYAIGVWVGYDDNRAMGHETGGAVAVPIYVEIMKQMNQPAKSFARPAHVVEATIDKKTGLLAPDGAPKGTTMSEVFLEGSVPTEVAPMPDDVTEDNKTKDEYAD
ncbi:MAG TPA: PBP1A family penicillin-binding protein [Kofleriaceae bacterium]|nr:PBP1A family penicillin-binding protein [Kofleriaceae bacterium]